MKKIFYILVLCILIGCYDDESQTIHSENVSHRASALSHFIISMSSHYASFDDNIDGTSCFSLDFPYQLEVNSELTTITSIDDVSAIHEEDHVEIIYPVNTNFYNYEERQANSQSDLNLIKANCNQDFTIEPNPCLNFQFPFILKEYNDLTESFETFQLNTKREVYVHFDNLHDNDLYEIDYPIFLVQANSDVVQVNSNSEFIRAYYASLQGCN